MIRGTSRERPGRKRRVEALDTVLFHGDELVSQFIAKVESVFVVPSLNPNQRFHKLWTHSGILVDKNVLPLDCLEPDKLYIYESIVCGNILNVYQYSKVLCVDHEINANLGFYIGPLIREWVPVVDEVGGDVAVIKLAQSERDRLYADLDGLRQDMLRFYNAHSDWGYPMVPLPQFAAASQDLYNAMLSIQERVKSVLEKIPGTSALMHPAKEIFCSEMVAKLYGELGVGGFSEERGLYGKQKKFMKYSEYTPLDLEVVDSLKGASGSGVIYAKLKGKVLLDLDDDPFGRKVMSIHPTLQQVVFPYLKISNENWEPVRSGVLPSLAFPSGYTIDGTPTYISRSLIGDNLIVGYTSPDGVMKAAWEGLELPIEYDHELLVIKNPSDFEWVQSGKLLMGAVPRQAIGAGCDASGNVHYIARTRLMDSGTIGLGALVLGRVSPSLGGARFVHQGKEVTKFGDYEVLCKRAHFLDRVFFGIGMELVIAILFAIFCYLLGVIRVHEAVIRTLM
ncbi:hypothetical protein HDU83_007645 [Entophlyctis luteolus]|nr:hypothetical protein HDU83_007645 [Entophlyctis luteolus]KAJ3378018.1 hypothetical protein HDU84_008021 [Entophlyctis sp. JEL0112]